MQQQIHATKPGNAIHQFDAEQRATLELLLLRAIQRVVLGDVIVPEFGDKLRGITHGDGLSGFVAPKQEAKAEECCNNSRVSERVVADSSFEIRIY
jgi:hypothetical protein